MIKIDRINCIVAVFEDDEILLEALKKSRAAGFKILDCFTPFPVHGIERILGIKRSNLGVAAFVFGLIGFLISLTLQSYSMRIDWPNNIGGKPSWPLTSFIPVLFELTVLCCALGMTFTFFWISGMFPGVQPIIYDKRATDDRFVVIFDEAGRGDEIRSLMQANGVAELRDDQYISHNFPGPLPITIK
ncbi:MAG: DUF3341 domain-containing protein [Chitinophagaceae bacterium]|nr:MAG: DUF3341 domain-containing protein [Chitinophagaceae bacterium]